MMGVGQKNEIYFSGFDRPHFDRNGYIMSLGYSAINEDILTTDLHQAAGACDAILPA